MRLILSNPVCMTSTQMCLAISLYLQFPFHSDTLYLYQYLSVHTHYNIPLFGMGLLSILSHQHHL